MNELTLHAFLLTLIAGLSTGIGSCIALLAQAHEPEIPLHQPGLFGGRDGLRLHGGDPLQRAVHAGGAPPASAAGGWADGGRLLRRHPADRPDRPGWCRRRKTRTKSRLRRARNTPRPPKLMRMGALTAMAIALHNFPEGLATFVSALQEPGVAIPIVAAIAIHNIPEGIAVSVPIYQATGSRFKAFRYSFLSGLAEPAGALIGWLILMPVMSDVGVRPDLRQRGRHHGVHLVRRASPRGARIRRTPPVHLRPHRRNGRHGRQPARDVTPLRRKVSGFLF